jgi:hypothetical protein
MKLILLIRGFIWLPIQEGDTPITGHFHFASPLRMDLPDRYPIPMEIPLRFLMELPLRTVPNGEISRP